MDKTEARLTLTIDAMGSDRGPEEILEGLLKRFEVLLLLVMLSANENLVLLSKAIQSFRMRGFRSGMLQSRWNGRGTDSSMSKKLFRVSRYSSSRMEKQMRA